MHYLNRTQGGKMFTYNKLLEHFEKLFSEWCVIHSEKIVSLFPKLKETSVEDASFVIMLVIVVEAVVKKNLKNTDIVLDRFKANMEEAIKFYFDIESAGELINDLNSIWDNIQNTTSQEELNTMLSNVVSDIGRY